MQSEIRNKFRTEQIYSIDFSIMVISDYYHNVLDSTSRRVEFRTVVMARTGMSQTSFYYKLATDKYRAAEREVINNIIKEWQDA